jgi:hypothetical protein
VSAGVAAGVAAGAVLSVGLGVGLCPTDGNSAKPKTKKASKQTTRMRKVDSPFFKLDVAAQ